jgi:hypothetical protein
MPRVRRANLHPSPGIRRPASVAGYRAHNLTELRVVLDFGRKIQNNSQFGAGSGRVGERGRQNRHDRAVDSPVG